MARTFGSYASKLAAVMIVGMVTASTSGTSAATVSASPTPAKQSLPEVVNPPILVRWTDPIERAFTVNVPRGWHISGGTHRNSPIDARNYVTAETKDGKVLVWLDAPNILPRQEPHPAYYQLGWFEGRVVQSPAGPLMIERFKTGAQYAEEFSSRACNSPQRLSAFDMPRATETINESIAPLAMRAGVHAQASAGDYTFRCNGRSGYAYAVTVLAYTTADGPHNWAVYKLAGYLADRPAVPIARYVMDAMVSSIKIDPAWQAAYDRQIHDTTGALMAISNQITQESIERAQRSLLQNEQQIQANQRTFDQMTSASMSSFHRQQASQDQIRQRWSDITLGQEHGCDDLGRCATVSNEYQYHWTDQSGNVVPGPSDGSAPGPEYHPWTPDNP